MKKLLLLSIVGLLTVSVYSSMNADQQLENYVCWANGKSGDYVQAKNLSLANKKCKKSHPEDPKAYAVYTANVKK